MKASLRTLALKGFRSFVEQSKLEFPENGLVLIKGPFSGSGKSSLLLSISHALGYCPYPATELQSWYGDEKLEVILGLDIDGQRITVTKGPKTTIESPTHNLSGATAVERELRLLTGLDKDLLAALTYRPQRTPGLFLSKTNAEMQEFLSTLLQLHKFDKAIEDSKEKMDDLADEHASAEVKEKYIKSQLEEHDKIEYPVEREVFLFEDQVKSAELLWMKVTEHKNEAQKQYDEIEQLRTLVLLKMDVECKREIAALPVPSEITSTPELERLLTLLGEINRRRVALAEQERVAKTAIMAERDKHLAKINELKSRLQNEPALKKQLLELENQQAKLNALKCPRCGQGWLDCKDDLANVVRSIQVVNNELRELPVLKEALDAHLEAAKALANRPPNPLLEQVEAARTELLQAVTAERASIKATNDGALAKLETQKLAIKDKYATEMQTYRETTKATSEALWKTLSTLIAEQLNAKDVLSQAQLRLAEVRAENTANAKRLKDLQDRRARLVADLAHATELRQQKEIELNQEADLLEALKAFLTCIFDEVLAEIAFNTNEMLAHVSNVAHVTIRFRSETVTNKDKIKRSIQPVLMIGGEERPLRSALSGGMMTAVELAVDLAVRKVISARSGMTPGWLILDECFEGLGLVEKEACMTLLSRAAQDTLILVVDHDTAFKEIFTETIEIQNEGGRSSIAGLN